MWKTEELEFLREYYPDHGSEKTAVEMHKRFGRNVARQTLRNRAHKLGIKISPELKKTQLQSAWKITGKTPREVGYINPDTGMIKTEIGWARLGAIMGIPKGNYLVHLDGDITNNDPSNLQVIPVEMSMRMTLNKFWSDHPEITKTGILCLTLEEALKETS